MPAQQVAVQLGERQLVIQMNPRLQRFFRKKRARRGPEFLRERDEVFLPDTQSGRHFMPTVFFEPLVHRARAWTSDNPSILRPLPFPRPSASNPTTIVGR
jgi:hypothetical protein